MLVKNQLALPTKEMVMKIELEKTPTGKVKKPKKPYKPKRPSKPKKQLEIFAKVSLEEGNDLKSILNCIPENILYENVRFTKETEYAYYGNESWTHFYLQYEQVVENEQYDKQMEIYEKKLIKWMEKMDVYNEKLEYYKQQKKLYNDYKLEKDFKETEEKDFKEYQRLKKKYE